MARENIDVTVELHDRLSRPADKAAASVEDLREEVDDLNVSMQENTKQTNQVRDAQGRFVKSTDAAAASTSGLTVQTNRGAKANDALTKSLDGVHGRMKRAAFGGKALSLVMKSLLVVGLVPLLYGAVGAITALGAAAYAAVAGLSPLVGLLGAMPQLLTGLIQTTAAVKLGFKGIGDAMKVLSDPNSTIAEIQEALDGLTPAGQRFVNVLGELKEQTAGWAKSVQSAMLPGFTKGLKALGPILPILEAGLTGTGWAVGRLAEKIGAFIGRSGPGLQEIMTRNTRMLDNGFGPALMNVLNIFRDLAITGGPLAERFSNWIRESTGYLRRMVAIGRETGDLERFFGRAGDLAGDVKDVLKDLSVALFNIGKESMVLADSMGASFGDVIGDFRAWTESLEGQKSIRQFFVDAIPVVKELGGLTLDLLQTLGGVMQNDDLVPMIQQIRTDLLPALGRLGSTLATDVGPAVINILTGMADALASLPITPLVELVKMLGLVAKGFGDLLQANPALATLVSGLATFALAAKLGGAAMGKFRGESAVTDGVLDSVMGRVRNVGAAFDTTTRANQRATMSVGAFARAEGQRKRAMAGGAAAMAGLALASTGVADKMGMSNTVSLALAGSLAGPWGAAVGAGVGALLDLTAAGGKAHESMLNLKKLTAEIGETGDVTGLSKGIEAQKAALADQRDSFQSVGDVFEDIGSSFKGVWRGDFTNDFNEQEKAIKEAEEALRSKNAYEAAAATDRRYLSMVERQRAAIEGQTAALRDSQSAFRSQFDAQTRLIEAQKAATAQAKSNKAGIKGNSAAALANRNALSALSGAWNDQSEKVRNNIGKYRQMRADFIKTATQMGVNKQRAKELARQLLDMPKSIETKVALKDEATERIRLIKEALASVKDKTVQVRVTASGTAAITPGFGPQPTSFSGNPTYPGFQSWVGEMGPELFMPRGGGLPQLIGANGPELMDFARAGYIVPNPTTPASLTKPLPAWVEARLGEQQLAVAAAPSGSGGGDVSVGRGAGETPQVHVHLHGDSSGLTMADVRTGAMQALREHEKQKAERS